MSNIDKRIDEIIEKYVSKVINEAHFKDKERLNKHYERHVTSTKDISNYQDLRMPQISIEEYDELADLISRAPAAKLDDDRNNRYIGYTSKSGRYVKYDTKDNYIVAYEGDPVNGEAVSLYRQPIAKFLRKAYGKGNPDYEKIADLPKEHSINYKNVWKVKYDTLNSNGKVINTSEEMYVNANYRDKALSKAKNKIKTELDNEHMDYTQLKNGDIEVKDLEGNVLQTKTNFVAKEVDSKDDT